MRFLLYVLAVLFTTDAHAQDAVAVRIDDAEELGMSIEQLDLRYRSALHTDPKLAVFSGRDEEVIRAWRELLRGFATHLQVNGFAWPEPLRGYYRFYFSPDGTIDHVLYDVPVLEEDHARMKAFGSLLDDFARSYQFGLFASEGFAQCSPAVLRISRK